MRKCKNGPVFGGRELNDEYIIGEKKKHWRILWMNEIYDRVTIVKDLLYQSHSITFVALFLLWESYKWGAP